MFPSLVENKTAAHLLLPSLLLLPHRCMHSSEKEALATGRLAMAIILVIFFLDSSWTPLLLLLLYELKKGLSKGRSNF